MKKNHPEGVNTETQNRTTELEAKIFQIQNTNKKFQFSEKKAFTVSVVLAVLIVSSLSYMVYESLVDYSSLNKNSDNPQDLPR